MENQNNNKVVIALLVIIISILTVLCILFATGTISFKSNDVEVNDSNQNITENNDYQTNDITLENIKEIFKVTYNYYELPVVYCGKTDNTLVEIYGTSRKASTEFATYDEMLNYLKKYMTIDVISGKIPWAATTKEYYLEKDGKLYCEETYKGYIYDHGNIEIEITSQEENKVTCIVTIELIDPDNNKTSDEVNITLEKNNNNWIITSYKK